MAQHDDKEARKALREQDKLAQLHEAQITKAIAACAATREGRLFLWWLLSIGQVGQQPFTANALNTAFNCGELNVGNQILARLIDVDPAIYVRMQQENLNDGRTAQREPSGGNPDPDEPGA
jgi:hypothetical protein